MRRGWFSFKTWRSISTCSRDGGRRGIPRAIATVASYRRFGVVTGVVGKAVEREAVVLE